MKETEQKTGLIQLDSQARALIESAAALRAQIVVKEVQIQGMQTYATGENAQLVEAQQELDGMRVQLAKLGGSGQNPGDLLPSKIQMTAAGMDYVRKVRDAKYYETIFDILARQFELAKLDEATEGALIQVVDPAIAPDKKSFPRRGLFVISATSAGLLIGILAALLRDCLGAYERRCTNCFKARSPQAGLVPEMIPPIELSTPETPGQVRSRHKRLLGALATSIFGKGSVLIVNAISVPIVVRYLGAERYGLWITISTTLAMVAYMDIGIASTLTNLISESYAANDRRSAGQYFATAFWMTVAVAAGLGILGLILWPHIDFGFFMHMQNASLIPEVSRSVMVAAVLFLCGLPAGLAARALAGYQELHIANLFLAVGNILALAAIIVVVTLKGSLLMLVSAYSGAIVLGGVTCLFWLCFVHKPWLTPVPGRIQLHFVQRVSSSGGQFFLIQLAGLVVFNSDNLVISHFLSPAEVTPYSVTWRLVTYANAIQILSNQALWPAYSEAWAKGDIGWMRSAYARVRRITVGTLAIACAVLIPFGRWIIRIWAGRVAVPDMPLLLLMCLWMAIFAFTSNQACLMGSH